MKLENRNMRNAFEREMAHGFIDQPSQASAAPFLDPSNSDHDSTRYAIYNYHKVISEYIKDSLNHNKQLIGMDMADELDGGNQGGLDASIILPSIDFVGFNPYYSVPNALIKSNTNNMKGYIDGINFLRNNVGLNSVPIIISEGGTDESYMECSNYDLDIVDKMTLPFTGVAGINAWFAYTPNKLESKNDVLTMPSYAYDMWDNTIRVKNHMNGNDVINTLSDTWGGWRHGMGKGKLKENDYDDVEAVEMQSYISSNKKLVVGYIRNRTYNVYTQSSGGNCDNVGWKLPGNKPVNSLFNFKWDDIKDSEQLKVEGLLTTKKYNVNFYGDNNGTIAHIGYDSKLTSVSGRLKIRYPELYVQEHWQNRPVIWFVAKREGYNGMTQNNDIAEDSTDVFLKEFLANEKDSLFQEASLKVYPNPFGDYITIESPVDDEILIQDPTGRVVLQKEISKAKNRIQTERLTKGIYFVRFVNQSQTFKLIKR